MREAQAAFDARAAPLCPSQLTAPVLHTVLAHPPIQPLVYGGKGVGSQVGGAVQRHWAGGRRVVERWLRQGRPSMQRRPGALPTARPSRISSRRQGDGTAQLLCRDAAAQAAVCGILQADFPGVACMPFTVPATSGRSGGSNGMLGGSAAGLRANGDAAVHHKQAELAAAAAGY